MSELNEPKKLRRGLKDVSPLFGLNEVHAASPAILQLPEVGVQCVSVFGPDHIGDSFFLNAYLGSRLAALNYPCTIVSVHSRQSIKMEEPKHQAEFFTPHLRRLVLSWDQFEGILHKPGPRFSADSQNAILLMDFEYSRVPYFEKIIPLLDKWIVVIKPQMESISEAYKMMKATLRLNSHLEYFLLVDGSPQDERGAILFERLSEMVSKRLGINLVWLGNFHLSESSHPLKVEMSLEHLFIKPVALNDSVEKRALADMVRSSQEFLTPLVS